MNEASFMHPRKVPSSVAELVYAWNEWPTWQKYAWNGGAIVLLATLLVLAPALLSDTFTYHRWDNLEYFAPIFKWAQGLLLDGFLPRVNLHQHLGEPFATNVQAGLYYPVYLVAVWLGSLFSLGDPALLALILIGNYSIGIGGFVLLAKKLDLPTPLALTVAVGAQAGAYALAYSGVWIFITSINAWLPWCLLGIWQLLAGKQKGAISLVVGLAMLGWVGHPQFWGYALLCIGMLAFISARGNLKQCLMLAPFFLAGILLAMPTMLPVIYFRSETVRSASIGLDSFLALSADWSSLAGMVTPLIAKASMALSPTKISILTYQGPLVVILLFVTILLYKDEPQKNLFGATLLTTAIFLVMALGKNTPLYPLTYHIPIWSSFRWPCKFLLFVQFGAAVLAIFGLRHILQMAPLSRRRLYIFSFLNIAVWFAVLVFSRTRSPLFPSPGTLGVLVTAISSLLLLPHADKRYVQWALCGLAIASSVSFNGVTHDLNLKNYPEGYRNIQYGFADNYRVMPTSEDGKAHPFRLGRLNLGMAATELKYLSLTGYTHPVVSKKYSDLIPSGIFGGIPRDWIKAHTANNFLDFFGVRYILAHLPEDRDVLEASGKYRVSDVQDDVAIYENPQAKPLAFFATQTTAKTDWNNPPDVVHATGMPIRNWNKGHISAIHLQPNGDVEINGNSEGEGFVVLTVLSTPGWKLSINGGAYSSDVTVVNDATLGTPVPNGNFSLKFRYFPPGHLQGWLCAFAGLMLASVGLYKKRPQPPGA